jgi:hypothetical protein
MKEIPLNHGYVTLVDDEDVGKVSIGTWRLRRNKNALYAVRSLRKGGHRTLYLHRFILDPPPHLEVDHINGNGLDNRRANLRLCTHERNCKNISKQARGRSRFRGVRWDKKISRWLVSCQGAYIGCFKDETEAARAYNSAASERFGAFARLNQIDGEGTGITILALMPALPAAR